VQSNNLIACNGILCKTIEPIDRAALKSQQEHAMAGSETIHLHQHSVMWTADDCNMIY